MIGGGSSAVASGGGGGGGAVAAAEAGSAGGGGGGALAVPREHAEITTKEASKARRIARFDEPSVQMLQRNVNVSFL
jgi:hypothetical protein